MGALTARLRFAARLAFAIGALGILGCGRGERMPAEAIRLIAQPRGTLAPSYTLADETRPVLALPRERRLDLAIPASDEPTFSFTLPGDLSGDVIATGSVQRAKHTYPLAPQVLARAGDDPARATLVLPDVVRGAGPAVTAHLTLTAVPAATAVETSIDAVAVPADARLELAVGLSPATAIAGAAPIVLEVVAAPAGGAERSLWTTTLQGDSAEPARWREATVSLTDLAGQRVRLVFRARAVGDGRAVVVPLWADPTIVALAVRPPARRNVILISLDTLRADRLGAYGAYRRTTPAIDAFARDAAVFTDAWSVWPETSGSHMSLFSSRFPSEHGVTSFITAPAPSLELLAERLRREGYLTRAFTEDGGVWAYAGFARGFSAYAERRSPDFVYRGEVDATFADATRWVEAHADRTFFLFVHTYQVHAPYAPPATYRALFTDVPGREPANARDDALAYDQEARYTDDHVGRFLTTLGRLGLSERSIVVLTSDHGEEFGEHGGRGHGRTLHQEVLRVPLVVSAPGMLAPAQVTTPASLLDVMPTVLDLLGLAADPSHRGTSLVANARAAAGRGEEPTAAGRPIFGEVDRVDRTRVQLMSVRRNHAAAITDLATGTTRCYGPDDRDEQQPAGACPELSELIDLHRRAMVPIGTTPAQQADPTLIEKMRALGYIQ